MTTEEKRLSHINSVRGYEARSKEDPVLWDRMLQQASNRSNNHQKKCREAFKELKAFKEQMPQQPATPVKQEV